MSDLIKVQMFRVKKQTKRFNLNQKVWIVQDHGNHLSIKFKWRGASTYATGHMPKWNKKWDDYHPCIGPEGPKEIDVTKKFAEFLGAIPKGANL